MKKIYHLLFLVFALGSFSSMRAPVTCVKNIPADFPTLDAAITALNTNGVGVGGATINIPAGYTETPVAALVLTMATNPSSASRPLVFQKSGAGANPLITAFVAGTSTTLDGLFVLNGVDYVTINGIDLQENGANVTATQQMEFGFALLKTSATNGCQYNTIKNCVVTLNKSNAASIGIYGGNHTTASVTGLTIATVSGTNSYNKFYNNTVQNSYGGYSITGFASAAPYDFYDQRNEIGVDGVSINPSQVLNFGGGAAAVNGILAGNQNSVKIFNTTISNGNTANTGTLNGISLTGGTNSNVDVYGNTLTLSSGATTSMLVGINNASGGTGSGSIVNIYNNSVTGTSFTTATSAEYRGIASTATSSYTNMYGNTVSNNTLAGTGPFTAIYYGGSSATLCLVVNINGNIINNNTKTGTAGAFNAINGSASANTINVYSNTITNNSSTLSSGATYGYYNFAFGLIENVYNNTITNLAGGSAQTTAIFANSGSGPTNKEVYGNTISGVSGNSAAALVGAIDIGYGTIVNVYNNNISNILNNTATGIAGGVTGVNININVNTQVSVYKNFISDLRTPSASNTNAINGIWLQGAATSALSAYYNTIYLNATSAGANFGTSAINCGNGAISIDLRNNILVNNSTPAGTGFTRAITRNAAALTNYALTSGYNCVYAGTPGPSNFIYSDGTNNDQTLQQFKNRVGPREQSSFSSVPPFVNAAITPYDLHLQTGIATQCESGAKSVAGLTLDFDGNPRGVTPDVGADEINGLTVDTASPDIQYALLSNSSVAVTRLLTNFATITDPSGINITAGTNPRIYYKKSTQANTYNDNTNATDGWKYVEASNAVSPFNFAIDYTKLFGGGVVAGDIIQYFVTAQDLNGTPMIGLNNGGFTTQPTSVNLSAANFPLNNTINQYTIVANAYSGNINVGPAETITSLTNAGGIFNLINTGVVSGNVTINITGDLTAETGTNALNQWAEEGIGNYTVTIVPSAAATRLISGSSAAASLVRFDGADRVTVDGRFGGSGTYLTFRNTSTAAQTVGFINDAQNNTLQYSIIESGNTAVSTTLGGAVFIGSTTLANGNDNIVISNCEIRDRSDVAGTPAMGINCVGNSAGTLAQYNNNVTISNNNIHDWFLANNANQFGLQMGAGNSGFNITGNSFYQTATRTNTVTGAVTRAINISFASTVNSNGGHTITGNFIGGTAPGANGGDMTLTVSGAGVSQTFVGISVTTGLIPNSIQNNTIRKIDYTTNAPAAAASMFLGINLGQGIFNVGNITGNTIGAPTGNDAIKITINAGGAVNSFLAGILAVATNGYFNIQNNTIGGITVAGTTTTGGIIPQWIQVQGTPTQNTTVTNNLIGSTTTANSIRVTATAPAVVSFSFRHLITSGAGLNFSGNTIQNVSNASTNTATADYGILLISTVGGQGTLTVNNNTIKDLTTAGAPATPSLNTLGISVQGHAGLTHDISGNAISGLANINAGAAAAYVVGIQTQGSSMGGSMNKNKIWDLRNSNTGASPGLAGVYISGGLNWTINNNRISITNGAGTNTLDVSGVTDVMAQNSILNMNYNSIYVGGTTAAGAINSVAFGHLSNSTVSLKNNLLYNERTGGTGIHAAISSASGTPSLGWNVSNNNAFVTSDATKVGIWGVTANNFATWKVNSGTDANSIADINTNVTSSALFVNTATGDLHINTSTFPEGLGTPIGSITTDFDGDLRSVVGTTIGSDELPCVAITPSIFAQTNASCNGTSDGSATISALGGNGITYSWSPSGGNAATATGLAAGTYTVTVTSACGGNNTINVFITEPAAINPGVSQSLGILTAAQVGATYQWYQCPSTLLVGEINQTYTPLVAGDYKVEVTVGGCTVTSACETVTVLSTEDFALNSKFVIYPNPSNGIVNIKTEFGGDYKIINQLGQTVKIFKVDANAVNTINVENLANGIYFIKAISGTKIGSQKLIIDK